MPRKSGVSPGTRGSGTTRLPMEWMDPLSWRLPSGQALAEFALQTGFLAPLMMRTPQVKKKSPAAQGQTGLEAVASQPEKNLEEAPARLASFRHNR